MSAQPHQFSLVIVLSLLCLGVVACVIAVTWLSGNWEMFRYKREVFGVAVGALLAIVMNILVPDD